MALHKKRKRKEMKLSKEKGERFGGWDGYPWSVYYADGCHLDVSKTVSASDLCAANCPADLGTELTQAVIGIWT